MYEFVDRPVTSLDHGGRFLVWSMRSWVRAMGDKRCPGEVMAAAFAKWNMTLGLQSFLRVMALFNRHGLETFGFCQLQCNHISEHEAIIISMVCSLRDSRPEAVRGVVEQLIDEDFVDHFIGAMSALGRSMDQASIFPSRPTRSLRAG